MRRPLALLALSLGLVGLAGCTGAVDGPDPEPEETAPSEDPKTTADEESAQDRPGLELGRSHVTMHVDNPGQTPM